MKTILIIIALLLVFGGAWYLYQNGTEPDLEMDMTEITTENETSKDSTQDTQNTGETPGNDAGMEFPTIDGSTSVSVDATAEVFNVNGSNHNFDLKEMRVRQGDTVTVHFTSAGGFHDWVVDEFNARTARVRDGGSASVTFVADQKGTFEYYCSVGDHRARGMVGTLIVE
jgi:plastocyanin